MGGPVRLHGERREVRFPSLRNHVRTFRVILILYSHIQCLHLLLTVFTVVLCPMVFKANIPLDDRRHKRVSCFCGQATHDPQRADCEAPRAAVAIRRFLGFLDWEYTEYHQESVGSSRQVSVAETLTSKCRYENAYTG